MRFRRLEAIICRTSGSKDYLIFSSNIRNNPLRLDGSFPIWKSVSDESVSDESVSGGGKQEHRAECRFKDSEQDTAYRIREKIPVFCLLFPVYCPLVHMTEAVFIFIKPVLTIGSLRPGQDWNPFRKHHKSCQI